MDTKKGMIYDDVQKCVDEVINYVGKDIVFCMTLALGKPVLFINELYRRAKEDPEIKLRILTALALERPRGHTDLEKRFLKPLADRIFDGVPEFDYMLDFRAGRLPPNVEFSENFSKAGGYLNDPVAQQNHVASNYTHCARDAISNGANVMGQLIGYQEEDGKTMYSMACNPDIVIEMIAGLKEQRALGRKVAIVGEANRNMPFMYGDAVMEPDTYDIILQGPKYDYNLFAPPKDAVSLSDYMIGLNVSTLIKDGGTIQVGIGALGDAIVAGLIMRNEHNALYQEILEKTGTKRRNAELIAKWGDTGIFKEGLYGASEMFVDAFMQMYKKGIIKRKVFESVPLMKLINAGQLSADNIPADIIDKLVAMEAVEPRLTARDFTFLREFGILKDGLEYIDGSIIDGETHYSADMNDEQAQARIRELLGNKLRGGTVLLGAFFIGPQAFYQALNDMSEEERQLFGMSGVDKVNQLYGGEELRRLQRKDGRFVNTGMVASVLGAVASDGLEDGRIISGIGGQYNFAAMAHALKDGRLIMMIKSTKGAGKMLKSNIVFSYGNCSIPRHLRDIIVTEYGIADVQGKTDKEVIAMIINIADSRFQAKLLEQAKQAKKIPADYEIPEEYRHNYPETIHALLHPYQHQGHFQPYPFGTDLTTEEMVLGGALKGFKALATGSPNKMITGLLAELFKSVPVAADKYLEMMKLDHPASLKEKVLQKTVVLALRNANRLEEDQAAKVTTPGGGTAVSS
ncbi:MAG: acetyl-CoA hydrolase/transferase C-terminal domain-containing protein [Syntrophomonadaceae bacterium]